MAAMQSDLFPETVYVTVFMEGLCNGVTRTEDFRIHPSAFEGAVSIAQNAEPNFKVGQNWSERVRLKLCEGASANSPAYCKPETMDVSNAEDDGESDIHDAIKRQDVLR